MKKGDRVICIDARASFGRLAPLREYVLTSAYDGTPTVEVNGAYHCLDRFILKSDFEEHREAFTLLTPVAN
jgi:hypothetical protein